MQRRYVNSLVIVLTTLIVLLSWWIGVTISQLPSCDLPIGQFCATYYNTSNLDGPAVLTRWEAEVHYTWQGDSPAQGVLPDQFSGRWQGQFEFPDGLHRFHLVSDDGARLWVDGELLIDAWAPHPETEHTAELDLSAGLHVIQVEYYEAWGWATLKLEWRHIEPCDRPDGQFCVDYYDNVALADPISQRALETNIDHDWGAGGPHGATQTEGFSARWQGRFAFAAGYYTFTATADEGIRVWVDAEAIMDAWPLHAGTLSTPVYLASGLHDITVEYYDQWGEASVQFAWQLVHLDETGVPFEAEPNTANATSPLGINITALDYWATEWPLLDVMKRSSDWLPQCQSWGAEACQPLAPARAWDTLEQDKIDLDTHGWVRSLPPAGDTTTDFRFVSTLIFFGAGGQYPAGQYIVRYEGEGTLEYDFDAVKNTALSGPGRDVIEVTNPSNDGILLRLKATDPHQTGNYIRNIRVIMPGFFCANDPFAYCPDEAACSAEEECLSFEQVAESLIFHPVFLRELRHYKVIRFMEFLRTNTSELVHWHDRPQLADARWSSKNGVPLEVVFALTERVNADAWVNMPARANDDYITQFAHLAKLRLGPSQRVYVEYGNEIWNTALPGGQWVEEQAVAEWPDVSGGPSAYTRRINWFGKRSAQVCAMWKQVWGAEKDRVVCVMGGFNANDWVNTQALTCPVWVAAGGQPCAEQMDALAIAPYFGGYLGNPIHAAQLQTWFQEPDGGLDKLFTELSIGGLLYDPTHEPEWERAPEQGALASVAGQIERNAQVAAAHGVDLIAYEGGPHVVGIGGMENNAALTALFIQANRDARMGELYTASLQEWKNRGGTLFVHFESVRQYTKWTTFGIKEFQTQDPTPKSQALLNFIQTTPRWWDIVSLPLVACESYTGYAPGTCAGTFKAFSLADLATYVENGFRKNGGETFRNLKIMADLDQTGAVLDIRSPCKITLAKDVRLSGDVVSLDGRLGVIDHDGYHLRAHTACILSEHESAHLGAGGSVEAETLLMRAAKMVKIGKQADIDVTDGLTLRSIGDSSASEVIIQSDAAIQAGSVLLSAAGRAQLGKDATLMADTLTLESRGGTPHSDARILSGAHVTAGDLTLSAPRQATIGQNTRLQLSGDVRVTATGSQTESVASVNAGSAIRVDGSLELKSGQTTRIARQASLEVGENLHVEAASPTSCQIKKSAHLSFTTTTGNCAENIP